MSVEQNIPARQSVLNEQKPLTLALPETPDNRVLKHMHFHTITFFFSTSSVLQNCYRASISNIGRPLHIKDYIVEVIRSDESFVPARISEPYQLIQLPADINTMSENE
uniref:39S ribosomal protein L55, mitochondrial (inferred by orthology to a human protein) n=1 Tax=Strongyloides venezuelensis TaxID=75913 RepID=A0A0K0G1J5_STRVS